MKKENWKIRIAGYGTFDFVGSEAEAEDMRRHKSQWERGVGHKWRATLETDVDKITAEICGLWDSGKGVPPKLMKKLAAAKFDQTVDKFVDKLHPV